MAKVTVGDIATYINGYSFKPDQWGTEGYPIVRIQNLTNPKTLMNHYKGDIPEKFRIRNGDLLISWSASLGVFKWDRGDAVLNQHIFKVVFDKPIQVNQEYYRYQMEYLMEIMERDVHGATMKHLTRKTFENQPFYLPDTSIQDHIANLLSVIDKSIKKCNIQLLLLNNLMKSRFNELVAGTNIIVPAEDLCSDIVDCPHSTPKYTGIDLKYPSIRTTDINNGQINWTTMKYVDHREYLERTRRLVPQPGDIVYSREGSYGDCVIIPENIEMCLGQRTMLFRPNRKKVTSEYMEEALRSEDVKKQADKNNTGSTVPHVNVKDAKRFLIPLVDLGSQEDFSGFVNQVNKSKLAIQKSIGELEH